MSAESWALEKRCIVLQNGNAKAWICPSMGGNCVRMKVGEAELLRSPETWEAFVQSPFVYGTPILLPPNRIADGSFQWRGQTYTLSVNEPSRNNHIHGFIAAAPFAVAAQIGAADCVTLQYSSACDERYARQKLSFLLTVRYALQKDSLTQSIMLRNGEHPLPLGLGQHTALRTPFLPSDQPEELRLSVPAREEWILEHERYLPTGERVQTSLTEAVIRGTLVPCAQPVSALLSLDGSRVELRNAKSNAAIRYELEGYAFMMLWNQGANPRFLCCEPQTWAVNAPNVPLPQSQTGFWPLEPGEKRIYRTKLSFLRDWRSS